MPSGIQRLVGKAVSSVHDAGLLLALALGYQVLDGLGDGSVVVNMITHEVCESKEALYLGNSFQGCQLGNIL